MKPQTTIKIELTPEQQEQVRKLTGRDVLQVKLNLEPLEGRLAPALVPN